MSNKKEIKPLTDIFTEQWLNQRPELQYALGKNNYHINEVNKWLIFFQQKNWLNKHLIKRLQSARTWPSYYAKINELRAGYFFDEIVGIKLTDYEKLTIGNKNVEFEGVINNKNILIEVKTPLNLERKHYCGGSFNGSDKIREVIDKSIKQLPNNHITIVVLSDDLVVPLVEDLLAQNFIWNCFKSNTYQKISAICILGNIYKEDTYDMHYAVNPYAMKSIDSKIFEKFKLIFGHQ